MKLGICRAEVNSAIIRRSCAESAVKSRIGYFSKACSDPKGGSVFVFLKRYVARRSIRYLQKGKEDLDNANDDNKNKKETIASVQSPLITAVGYPHTAK